MRTFVLGHILDSQHAKVLGASFFTVDSIFTELYGQPKSQFGHWTQFWTCLGLRLRTKQEVGPYTIYIYILNAVETQDYRDQ